MRTLRFINKDAKPKETVLEVSEGSVEPIMTWYGAYHAGDRYTVYLDDKELSKDENGELLKEPSA